MKNISQVGNSVAQIGNCLLHIHQMSTWQKGLLVFKNATQCDSEPELIKFETFGFSRPGTIAFRDRSMKLLVGVMLLHEFGLGQFTRSAVAATVGVFTCPL